jgi:hypothetical protein
VLNGLHQLCDGCGKWELSMEGVASMDHINSTSCVLIQHYNKVFVKRGVEGKIVAVCEMKGIASG